MTQTFQLALTALDSGDLAQLQSILLAHPEVVHDRVPETEEPYAGYFAGATLLHHVAGNPIRCPLPTNILKLTNALIDAGADVKATVGGGPTQPHTSGGNLLGLVASSAPAAMAGVAKPMIDLLLKRGVTLDDDRGVLHTALYHTVECQLQRDVGKHLFVRGARTDLVYAAALGEAQLIDSMFNSDGSLTDIGRGTWRADCNKRSEMTDAQIIQEALIWACMNGRNEMIDPLLARGAALNDTADVARWTITPLHGAAWGGWIETVAWLLERGADHTIIDSREQCTALGWATYCKRDNVIELFKARCRGRLTLMDAIEVGDSTDVDAALDTVADINASPAGLDAGPGVLLRIAAYSGRLEVVQLMLARGADPSLSNNEGTTALDIARKMNHEEVVALLS